MRYPTLLVSFSAVFAAAGFTSAIAADDQKVTYSDHVLPIFRNACLNCHNPDKKKAGLDLSTYAKMMEGSEGGQVINPGNVDDSLLYRCIFQKSDDPKMPPKGDKLPDAEIAVIKNWIAGFALETASSKPAAAKKNNVGLAVVTLERPDGPPPMPGDLPLEPVVQTGRTTALVALAASPWAPLVAVGGQKQIILYNTDTLAPVGILPFPEGFPSVVRFSRNGQLLLTGGGLGGKSGKVVLWNVITGERSGVVGDEVDQVLAADVSPDHGHVALGGPTRVLKIYSTKDGSLEHSIKKHTDWVTAISFSPDGKFLASADRNGAIVLWEGASGNEFSTLEGHKAMVTALSFMPGVLASGSEDGKIALWDVKEGKQIKSWDAHGGGVASLDFTPDGRLVSCGRDKVAKVWNRDGQATTTSEPLGDIAVRAALSGERVIAGDWTGAIRVFGLDGKPVGELTANPAPIADRLAAAAKILETAGATRPELQRAFDAATAQVKMEKDGVEAQRQAAVAAAEKRKQEASEKLAAAKETPDVATALQKEIAEADAEIAKLKTPPAASEAAPDAEKIAALSKKLEELNQEIARRREVRAAKQQNTPEYDQANNDVQGIKPEIANVQKDLETAQAAMIPPKGTAAEEQLAQAKKALEASDAAIATAKVDVDRWTKAQAFMVVHRAAETLKSKEDQLQELQTMAKAAFVPVEQAKTQIANLGKQIAAAPNIAKEKELAANAAGAAAKAAQEKVAETEKQLNGREAQLAGDGDRAKKVAELEAKLSQLNQEIASRREKRAQVPQGTPEYDQANELVQGIKPEIAETEKSLAEAKGGPDENARKAMESEIAQARDEVRVAQKTSADAQKIAETATADWTTAKGAVDRLKAELGQIKGKLEGLEKSAKSALKDAETQAAALTKELKKIRSDAERAKVEYEARWRDGGKPKGKEVAANVK